MTDPLYPDIRQILADNALKDIEASIIPWTTYTYTSQPLLDGFGGTQDGVLGSPEFGPYEGPPPVFRYITIPQYKKEQNETQAQSDEPDRAGD